MGIENRDYLRDDQGTSRRGMAIDNVDIVKKLIIANVIIFVLQVLWTRTDIVETPFGNARVTESVVQSWLELDSRACWSVARSGAC